MRLSGALGLLFALMAAPGYGQSSAQSGLKATITLVAIPNDRRPVVTFKITDVKGKPLELDDLDSDSVKFTIAALREAGSGQRA